MDKALRNRIQNATQAARRLLEQEFGQQLEGDYNILPDGRVLPSPSLHLDARGRALRAKLVAAIGHHRAAGLGQQEARDDLLREAAFTTLNRFVALKMLETRGVVQECVSKGDQSAGFNEFSGLAPGLIDLPDRGYRLYLESLCDEIGREVRVLFDRRDVAGLLWPRRPALLDLLAILNAPELAEAWQKGNDETVGWVYQYFNGEDERRKMRDESAAPRNSRELAVRNQFFTPSYVVQFLADNTLGRIWYEMCEGKTALVSQCMLMLRRPGEHFLKAGEQPATGDDLAVLHRPLRDPRELAVLDPAVGSGHYLLYCFLLLATIYREAWDDHPALLADLREEHDRESFLRQVPALILRHNLYGVDIDPRAAQIAELALWMRAQSAYEGMSLARGARPVIAHANIVVAEPMPGDQAQLDGFLQTLDARLRPLVRTIWKQMQLAGEAGTLLRIERAVDESIEAARRNALAAGPGEAGQLSLRAAEGEHAFWIGAEDELRAALALYAAQATGAEGMTRRLFAANVEQGVAFLDFCRRRYDVVLMNPPFGAASKGWKQQFEKAYPRTKNDLYAAFVERGLELLRDDGLLGAITSRTGFFLAYFRNWRELLLHEARPYTVADLGQGVLDSAMVETAAYCLQRSGRGVTTFFRLLAEDNKESALVNAVSAFQTGDLLKNITYLIDPSSLDKIPYRPFAYWAAEPLVERFKKVLPLTENGRVAQVGASTKNDARYLRSWWEVDLDSSARSRIETVNEKRWVPFAKGGSFSRYYYDCDLIVDWQNDGQIIKTDISEYRGLRGWGFQWTAAINGHDSYFRPGNTWPRRTQAGLNVRPLPRGCIFADKGPMVCVPGDNDDDLLKLLGVMNGIVFRALVDIQMAFGSYEVGVIQRTPVPPLNKPDGERVGGLALNCVRLKQHLDTANELSHLFWLPALLQTDGQTLAARAAAWGVLVAGTQARLDTNQREIDDIAFKLYGLEGEDRAQIEASLSGGGPVAVASEEDGEEATEEGEEEGDEVLAIDSASLIADLVSYAVGVALGRWDLRCATGERARPELPDPFAPLPVYSPGMLRPEDEAQALMPLRAILVDDPGHDDDIDAAVRQVFAHIFGKAHQAIYAEAAQALAGGPDLRPYLRNSFFEAHISRYSKSRRRAPIYWCLNTSGRRYAVWVAYHRAGPDTLYRVLRDYLNPKIQFEDVREARLRTEGGASPTRAQRAAIEEHGRLLDELRGFRDDLDRVAPLWRPERDDGVIINFAPLWRLVGAPRKWRDECRATWERLKRGDYDWSLTAMRVWPERVVPKCRQDRSLAIAHGFDETFWREVPGDRAQPRSLRDDEVQQCVDERSSAAVRDALFRLESTPAIVDQPKAARKTEPEPKGTTRRGRKPRTDVQQTSLDLNSEEEQ